MQSDEVRWTTSDRGLRYYEAPDGHELHESSSAESPHLWVNGTNMSVDEAAFIRDEHLGTRWAKVLSAAIDGHYQTRKRTKAWEAGDPCDLCGSHDTVLEDNVAGCRGCDTWEDGR